MNVAVIIVETPVESNRVCAKAAECFGNDACAFTIRVLAEFGTRTELSTWGYENSCCHCRLLVVSRVRRACLIPPFPMISGFLGSPVQSDVAGVDKSDLSACKARDMVLRLRVVAGTVRRRFPG